MVKLRSSVFSLHGIRLKHNPPERCKLYYDSTPCLSFKRISLRYSNLGQKSIYRTGMAEAAPVPAELHVIVRHCVSLRIHPYALSLSAFGMKPSKSGLSQQRLHPYSCICRRWDENNPEIPKFSSLTHDFSAPVQPEIIKNGIQAVLLIDSKR